MHLHVDADRNGSPLKPSCSACDIHWNWNCIAKILSGQSVIEKHYEGKLSQNTTIIPQATLKAYCV